MRRSVIASLALAASTIMASESTAQTQADSNEVRRLALQKTVTPVLGVRLTFTGDTARVQTLSSTSNATLTQFFTYVKRAGRWELVSQEPFQRRPAEQDTAQVKVFRGSQLTPVDTLAIKKAAADGGEVDVYQLFITGDTAWVYGATAHTKVFVTSDGDSTATGFEHWKARVEKRNGTWVRVSRTNQ